jgi:hypothetical protein
LQLSKYPVLANLERQTNVPKVYVILGLVGIYFFLVFFNIAGEFLVNFAGFLLPGYYSLQALFTSNTQDDTQVRILLIPLPGSVRSSLTFISHSGSPYVPMIQPHILSQSCGYMRSPAHPVLSYTHVTLSTRMMLTYHLIVLGCLLFPDCP